MKINLKFNQKTKMSKFKKRMVRPVKTMLKTVTRVTRKSFHKSWLTTKRRPSPKTKIISKIWTSNPLIIRVLIKACLCRECHR